MEQKFTIRVAMVLFTALIAFQYHSCKKIDLERQVMIRTVEAEDVDAFSATLYAEVIDAGETGDITDYGFVFSTSTNPTVNDRAIEKGSNITTGEYQSLVDALQANTTYYFRSFARYSDDEVFYGNEESFKTLPGDATTPTVITGQVSDITRTEATVSGNVTDNGGAPVAKKGFCIGTSPDPTVAGPSSDNGSGTGQFNHTFTGLDENTTYYVRAYAENNMGVAYGQNLEFTTDSGGGPINEWLHYDDGVNADGIGVSGEDFDAVIRFPTDALQPYSGTRVSKVRFFAYSGSQALFNLEIYTGEDPDATLPDLYESIPSSLVTPGEWNEYTLLEEFPVTANADLWVGFYITDYEAAEYPMGTDEGPAVAGFGDLTYDYSSGEWFPISSIDPSLDMNWNIQVFVTNESGEELMLSLPGKPSSAKPVSAAGADKFSSKSNQSTTKK
ncbi:MAG: hypothetical protein ACLFPE_11675 [Bacteroidales bacterium]